jgi:hypothetical protein
MFKKISNLFSAFVQWVGNIPKAFFKLNLSHNTGTKIFSLILAVLFWIFVMDQVDPEISRIVDNVPVNLINIQELDQNNLQIMNQHDYAVSVEVTGRRNDVLNLSADDISLWSDMRTVRKGTNNVYINSSINSDSVNISAVLPSEIVMTVDKIVSLPKPVKILFNDDFPENYYQLSLAVDPEEVKVTGAESVVNTVSYLGASMTVGSQTEDITRQVSLVPYSYDGEVVSGVTLDMNYATATLKIGKSQTATVGVDVQGEPMEGYEVVAKVITPSEVTLSGPSGSIENITQVMTEPIQLNGEETESFIVEKDLVLPDGVTAVDLNEPIQVEIDIEEVQTKDFTFLVNEIPILDLQDPFETNLAENNSTVTVRVTDVQSVIESLAKTDIKLDLDLGIVEKPGIYRLKVNMTDRVLYKDVTIDPVYVEVIVTDPTDSGSQTETTTESSTGSSNP